MSEVMINDFPITGKDHPADSPAMKLEHTGYWARLMAKSNTKLLSDAIADFGEARRACLSFVFKQATVRQEGGIPVSRGLG